MTLTIVYCNLPNLSSPLNCEHLKAKGQVSLIHMPPSAHLPWLELRVCIGESKKYNKGDAYTIAKETFLLWFLELQVAHLT